MIDLAGIIMKYLGPLEGWSVIERCKEIESFPLNSTELYYDDNLIMHIYCDCIEIRSKNNKWIKLEAADPDFFKKFNDALWWFYNNRRSLIRFPVDPDMMATPLKYLV